MTTSQTHDDNVTVPSSLQHPTNVFSASQHLQASHPRAHVPNSYTNVLSCSPSPMFHIDEIPTNLDFPHVVSRREPRAHMSLRTDATTIIGTTRNRFSRTKNQPLSTLRSRQISRPFPNYHQRSCETNPQSKKAQSELEGAWLKQPDLHKSPSQSDVSGHNNAAFSAFFQDACTITVGRCRTGSYSTTVKRVTALKTVSEQKSPQTVSNSYANVIMAVKEH